MPIHGYPGNVITANPVAPTSTVATGVWTTEQQLKAVAAGNWPFTIPTQQIASSLRFNSTDSAYLSRTPASAGNRKTWTWNGWVKRSGSGVRLFCSGNSSVSLLRSFLLFGDNISFIDVDASNTTLAYVDSVAVFRDYSAWYCVTFVVDTTQATGSNRIKLYVNGVQQTLTFSTTPSQNADLAMNAASRMTLGTAYDTSSFLDCYMAEVNFIDGQALTPASFGQTNAGTGVWEPIPYTGTYGTNGFYLKFPSSYSGGSFSADFLVIAGGGGGGMAGGGAGGYRTSAGTSGANSSAESALTLSAGTSYTVTVGAGGTAGNSGASPQGGNGGNSVFSTITSTGGGGGGGNDIDTGLNGGSGGGAAYTATPAGTGTANQGRNGGTGSNGNGGTFNSGGGGGASGLGSSTTTLGVGGAGGDGLASTITGSSVTRGGGGGGGAISSGGAGGSGGGGNGGSGTLGTAGTANTGGGGGGYGGRNGGSGVVIIKIPSQYSANFTSGVTYSISTAVSGFKIYTVTATSTTSETVTFV